MASASRSRLHHPRTQLQSSPTTASAAVNNKPNSTISSHLAMVELKHRILSSLSKLSDRDTHHLAVDDLEKLISSLPPESLPVLLHSLLQDPPSSDPSAKSSQGHPSIAKRECLRLLALLCASHPDTASTHLPKILAHIARRLKDPSCDSSMRDACRDTAGTLASLYLGNTNDLVGENYTSVVALFVKPLLEAMGEQTKGVQAGAAACLARVVECAGGGGGVERRAAVGNAFQKLVPRTCKLLGGQSFLAKGALLSVVSSLSQVGAITPQSMQSVLQCIRDCLESGDWATRKAAADILSALAFNSSHLVGDGAASTLAALEACRFDKVKPVRDSMSEALAEWKKLVMKDNDSTSEDMKCTSGGGSADSGEKLDAKGSNAPDGMMNTISGDVPTISSPVTASNMESKNANLLEKTVVLLKKRAPSLSDKELNPEFFQKLQTRSSDDLPVEVVLPRKFVQSSRDDLKKDLKDDSKEIPECDGVPKGGVSESRVSTSAGSDLKMGPHSRMQEINDVARDRWSEQRVSKGKELKMKALDADELSESSLREISIAHGGTSRTENHNSEINNKGSWFSIQRQLSQLERQQANLMSMLQDFMGGSHDNMITLENRVRGLERIVEDMARELSLSGRRSTNMMVFDGSPGFSSSKFNGFSDYNSKYGRGPEGRVSYTERYLSSDGTSMRSRDSAWRSESEGWGTYGYPTTKNGSVGSRRGFSGSSVDGRLPRMDHDDEQVGNRRGWEKGQGPFRLGEGPSARSVWQASKDEATLEAIRVAGDDNGVHRPVPKKPIAELDAEVEDQNAADKGPLWTSWMHAMDSLHVGDVDSAYAEILSTEDDFLLVKLMDKSGPVLDQLSSESANELLHAVGQFFQEQSLHDLGLTWIQQLSDLVAESGPEFLGIQVETKRAVLSGLHEASSVEVPEEWEGATAEQLMMHLAGAWGINLQQLVK